MTNQILTKEHITAIQKAHSTITNEIVQMDDVPEFGPPGYYDRRLRELCPAEAHQAWHRFLDDRQEAAKRIDPHTCSWGETRTYGLDPYGILGGVGTIEKDFVVWDDSSKGPVESRDLNVDQYKILRQRIEREGEAEGSDLSADVIRRRLTDLARQP